MAEPVRLKVLIPLNGLTWRPMFAAIILLIQPKVWKQPFSPAMVMSSIAFNIIESWRTFTGAEVPPRYLSAAALPHSLVLKSAL